MNGTRFIPKANLPFSLNSYSKSDFGSSILRNLFTTKNNKKWKNRQWYESKPNSSQICSTDFHSRYHLGKIRIREIQREIQFGEHVWKIEPQLRDTDVNKFISSNRCYRLLFHTKLCWFFKSIKKTSSFRRVSSWFIISVCNPWVDHCQFYFGIHHSFRLFERVGVKWKLFPLVLCVWLVNFLLLLATDWS